MNTVSAGSARPLLACKIQDMRFAPGLLPGDEVVIEVGKHAAPGRIALFESKSDGGFVLARCARRQDGAIEPVLANTAKANCWSLVGAAFGVYLSDI